MRVNEIGWKKDGEWRQEWAQDKDQLYTNVWRVVRERTHEEGWEETTRQVGEPGRIRASGIETGHKNVQGTTENFRKEGVY